MEYNDEGAVLEQAVAIGLVLVECGWILMLSNCVNKCYQYRFSQPVFLTLEWKGMFSFSKVCLEPACNQYA